MPPFKKKDAPVETPVVDIPEDAPVLPAAADNTLVEVWERRFQNPGSPSSSPVKLNVPGMICRWVNTQIEGRYHRAVYEQGWQPVPVKLLHDPNTIPDLYKNPENKVCRGERGREVLMMMPVDVYKKIQARKAQINKATIQNLRGEIAGAAAQKFGSEAGDFVHAGQTRDGQIKTVGTVNFGTERIPMGAE